MVEAVYLGAIVVLMGLAVGLMVRNEIRALRRDTATAGNRVRDDLAAIRTPSAPHGERAHPASRTLRPRPNREHG